MDPMRKEERSGRKDRRTPLRKHSCAASSRPHRRRSESRRGSFLSAASLCSLLSASRALFSASFTLSNAPPAAIAVVVVVASIPVVDVLEPELPVIVPSALPDADSVAEEEDNEAPDMFPRRTLPPLRVLNGAVAAKEAKAMDEEDGGGSWGEEG